MRPIPIVLVALFAVACEPTAQVINSPTPSSGEASSLGPTASPNATASASGPVGSQTPITLVTPSPVSLSTPTPFGSPATPAPTSGPSATPFGPFARVAAFPVSGAYEVTDVSTTSTGYVAVGFGGLNGADYYGLRQGIVWTSTDGINWIELLDPTLVNVSPLRVVAKGSDLFMAGTLSACSELDDTCTDVPQAGNGIWQSTNGGPWQLLPQLASMQTGLIDNMFLDGDQLVVFGGGGDPSETTTVWMSRDGVNWTSTTDLAGMDPVTSMMVGPAGLTAFGTVYDEGLLDVLLIAATSSDGAHYSAGTAPQMTGAGIDDLAAGTGGMVGVGYKTSEALDTAGVAVKSSDGANWTQATNSDGSFGGSGLQTVHALPAGGYVALGNTPHADDFTLEDGDAWYSADGSDWKLIAHLDTPFSQLSTSALGSAGVVVFASEMVDVDEDTVASNIYAWFAPLASLHG